jgi:hypothetical protein
MEKSLFFVCRVLARPDRLDFVVLQELAGRHDVKAASKGFTTKAAAEKAIKQLGGNIPDGLAMYLDFFEEDFKTVWCWKDERTYGASQTFESEREAVDAWDNRKLIFDPPP